MVFAEHCLMSAKILNLLRGSRSTGFVLSRLFSLKPETSFRHVFGELCPYFLFLTLSAFICHYLFLGLYFDHFVLFVVWVSGCRGVFGFWVLGVSGLGFRDESVVGPGRRDFGLGDFDVSVFRSRDLDLGSGF